MNGGPPPVTRHFSKALGLRPMWSAAAAETHVVGCGRGIQIDTTGPHLGNRGLWRSRLRCPLLLAEKLSEDSQQFLVKSVRGVHGVLESAQLLLCFRGRHGYLPGLSLLCPPTRPVFPKVDVVADSGAPRL